MADETKTITVSALARVEGEGRLTLRVRGDRVEDAELEIFEPPRLFEALLRGRAASEAPDITARICGICPVAYQMSACYAVEAAAGAAVTPQIAELRRLLYCGEWIQSHALHIVMLHAPDFLGVDDVIGLSALAPERVRGGLAIKKAGNAIMTLVGGREVHPINVKVGGFYRCPPRESVRALVPVLERARDEARELAAWASGFSFPDLERDVELVALRDGVHYPFCDGRLVSNRGLDIEASAFEEHVVEEHVARSTALHARIVGRETYVCGPLARFALNYDVLGERARDTARSIGLEPSCRNPYKTILARAVELVQALDEAIAITSRYEPFTPSSVDLEYREARGTAITEAPRGILYHRYDVDASGALVTARIVPPTSQNLRSIELDLIALGPAIARLEEGPARRLAEQAVRNYDPCISCSTHFLKVVVDRRP